jgi:hypothetical protein
MIYLVSFVLVLSIAGNASADLVVRWSLDEGSGTTALDSSGNGYDGEFIGEPQWVTGHGGGGALEFDGNNDNLLYSLEEATAWPAFSITLWVKATTLGQNNYRSVFSSHYGATAGFQINVDGGNPGNYQINPPGGLIFGTVSTDWVHLAMIAEGTHAKLYHNGEFAKEGTLSDSIINQFRLGVGRKPISAKAFACTIDEFRMYDHAISEGELLSAWSGIWPYAFGPEPADGAIHAKTWASISWEPGAYGPGAYAASHDVYFSDNFDDVDVGAESVFQGNQAWRSFDVGFPGFPYPDGLVPGTTYYWRIDEVSDTEPNSPWKGDIWSFSVPPKTAHNPDPADGAEFVDPNVELSWTQGFGAELRTVYFGDNFDDVNNALAGLPQGATTYSPGPLELEKIYYWRVDEFDGVETHKGDIWSFTTPGAVGNPQPANGAVEVQMITTLSWTPSDNAASHELYFGTDKDAVNNATTASPEYVGPRALGSESYDPGKLAWSTAYHWRVDEVYPAETVRGLVWTFTTANFIIVDDFENYNGLDPAEPESNRIFNAWLDGFGDPAVNGSVVGGYKRKHPPFTEQTIVHSGEQSMPFAYDNGVGKSEATLTLTYPRDWTENGVNTLTIWYIGDAANAAENLYAVLNDSAVVTHDNPDAVQTSSWAQWNINLQAFADQGVDLANVNTISLGLGDRNNPVAGGSGMIYFDDIRLYATTH